MGLSICLTSLSCVSIYSMFSSLPFPSTTYCVTIPAITPTFSLTSRPAASPEVLCDTSYSHMPLGLHIIHPHAPLHTLPYDPVSHPHWVWLQELPPSIPDAPDEPESSADPQIDSAVMTEDLSILQGLLLSRLPWANGSGLLSRTLTWDNLPTNNIHNTHFT